jgi:hydrogenase expression/formation protein HypE
MSDEFITLAHGAGGRLTERLLDEIFRPAFGNPTLNQQHDGAIVTLPSPHIAITTDNYVVDPLFFPGGNIGELAITGTLNDLAMCGAEPLYITCAFILTEGLPLTSLVQIVESMRQCALTNHIQIVAGDTKVVEKTASPAVYINTTGIGMRSPHYSLCPQNIEQNDVIILSGDIGRHGLAVLGQRGNFNFTPPIESDCAPLWPLVCALIKNNCVPHCLRDLTRGGLAGALIELAKTRSLSIEIDEKAIPISQPVHAGCELLGIDPLYVANEGRMIVVTPAQHVTTTLELLHQFPAGQGATPIGRVLSESEDGTSSVILKTPFGSKRKLALFSGEQLPRIC